MGEDLKLKIIAFDYILPLLKGEVADRRSDGEVCDSEKLHQAVCENNINNYIDFKCKWWWIIEVCVFRVCRLRLAHAFYI